MCHTVLIAWNRQSTLFHTRRIWSIIEICENYVNYEENMNWRWLWGWVWLACSGSVVILHVYSSQAKRHDVRNSNNVIMCEYRGVYWDTVFWSGGDRVRSTRGTCCFIRHYYLFFSSPSSTFLPLSFLSLIYAQFSFQAHLSSLMKKSVEIVLCEKVHNGSRRDASVSVLWITL